MRTRLAEGVKEALKQHNLAGNPCDCASDHLEETSTNTAQNIEAENRHNPETAGELRKQAEEKLKATLPTADLSLIDAEPHKLLHELQVHQIELESQNAELIKARYEAEYYLNKYKDLHDLAPVGYFTLDRTGNIKSVNFTGAEYLRLNRSLLINTNLDTYITAETRPVFRELLNKVFASEVTETCEVVFQNVKHVPLIVQVKAKTSESSDECLAIVTDITELKKNAEDARVKYLQQLLLDHFPGVALLIRTSTREVLATNQAGINVGAICGSTCFTTVGQSQDPCPWCLAPDLWATGKERQIVIEAGGKVWEAHWVPVDDEYYMHYSLDITEQKRTEEKLMSQEKTIQQALCISNSYTFDWDTTTGQVQRSNSSKKIFGSAGDELFNASAERFLQNIHPDDQSQFVMLIRNLTPSADTYTTVFRLLINDGMVVTLSETAQAFFDNNDKIQRVLGFATDITEYKRSEEALRKSEERFRDIANASADWIWEVDSDCNYVFASGRVMDVLGYGPDEILGRSPFDLMPPDEAERVRQAFKVFSDRSAPFQDLVNVNMHKNGSIRYILTSGIPVIDSHGILRGYRGVDKDITPRKHAEELLRNAHDELEKRVKERTEELVKIVETSQSEMAERKKFENLLRLSESKFSTAFHSSPDALNINRLKDGLFIEINEGFTQNTGYTPDDVIGKSSIDINIWLDIHDRALLASALAESGFVNNFEAQFRRKDGSVLTGLMSASIIEIEGEPCIFSITCDITDRKQTEHQLIELNKKLHDLNDHLETVQEQERIAIARDIHDELGQDITVLKLDLEIIELKLPVNSSILRPYVSKMKSGIELIASKIQRIAAELRPPLLDTAGLAAAIEYHVDEIRKHSDLQILLLLNNTFDDDIDNKTSTVVMRIVQEGLTNIIRHSQATLASVSCYSSEGNLVLEISDNGLGISQDQLTSSKAYGLIGMRERARNCNADFTIAGNPGGGTKLSLSIPVLRFGVPL
jgi:PAS domain S-box-containing protein